MYFDNLTLLGLGATVAIVGLILHLIFSGECPLGGCREG